jgi:HEPN domain-containing protein
MPHNQESNHAAWLQKAEEDELSVRAVLKEGAPSTACFLSQQMAEKSLKALLVFQGKEFPKVHDLLVLESLLLEIIPEVKTLHEDLNFLSSYYIETRYPGDFPEFSKDESQEAYEAASRVKKFSVDMIWNQ